MAQMKYKLEIQLLSDSLIGSAIGYGAVIDKDSVFDETGLPIIPGKRVKGILREQAELLNKFIPIVVQPYNNNETNSIDLLFGKAGITDKSTEYLSVSNFMLTEYHENKASLLQLINDKKIYRSEVIKHFTTLRMMTRIDKDGIAADTSLRTFRVLKKGLVFTGDLWFDSAHHKYFKDIIALTRRIGSMRNRGLGHIQCRLITGESTNIKPIKNLAE